jgi:hypothetical protein
VSLQLPGINFSGSQLGAGAYVDAGFEFYRGSHTHPGLGARIDLPFYTIGNTSYVSTSAPSKFYYAPISLEARITF